MRLLVILFSLSFSVLGWAAAESETTLPFYNKFRSSYWGSYSGPPVADIGSKYTTDFWGQTEKTAKHPTPQNADDLLTLGYQVSNTIQPGVGVPFNFYPGTNGQLLIETKSIYFGIVDALLVKTTNFQVHADFRLYTPVGKIAQDQDIRSGFRNSYLTLYQATDNLVLGSYSFIRFWAYGPTGIGYRPDMELYFSPFANYRLSGRFWATLWSDVVQLSHEYGKTSGLSNLPVDIQPGIRFDITKTFNVNPSVNLIPGKVTWDNIALHLVVMASI